MTARVLVMMLVLAILNVPSPVAAQEAVNFGSVGGRVLDPAGAVVIGAEVAIRQADTSVEVTGTTDREGRFRFPYLRAGAYELTVRAGGFAPAMRRVTVSVGSAFDVTVQLSLGVLDTAVNVTADLPLLEAARSQIASTVMPSEVRTLPLNGRQFQDLALVLPGVSTPNIGGGTQLFAETSAVPGVGLSIGSQRNLSNNFMVDGLSANDDAAALAGLSVAVDAIDQFQVVTSGGQAELGRALGGHINIATKSGTNLRQTDAYLFLRDDRFNGVNPILAASPFLASDPALDNKLPMHQDEYGVSIGGPVVRNRTFYFVNVEQRRLDQSGLVSIGASDSTVVDRINARLAAVGYRGPAVETGIYRNPVNTTHAVAKLDHHLSGADLLTIRYGLYMADSRNARGAGGTSAPSASSSLDNQDHSIAVANVWSWTPRTIIESRGQISHGDLRAPPSDPVGPAVSIAGVAAFGTLSSSPTRRQNTMYQVVNNLSHQAGAHAIRAGVDLLVNDNVITFPRAVRGSYSFSSLNNFLNGVYNNAGYTQTFGDSVVGQTNPNLGLYVQDEWRVLPDLTLNLGLRYDVQWLDTIRTDRDNVSPRLGGVWSPLGSHRLLVRASAGRFYDRVPLRALANALLSAGNTTELSQLRQIGVTLSPGQASAPAFPGVLDSIVPTTTLVNFTTMDRDIQNAYADQASIEVERQFGSSGTLSVGYDHLRGRRLIMSINQNVPTCAVAGSNNGCRPNPAFANNSQYRSAGSSVYDGFRVALVQRPSRWGSYRVSYTLSKSMNNVGEAFFNGPIDPFDLSKDWARSDDDQRHRLAVSGALNTRMTPAATPLERVTNGFQVSWIVQYTSALPFNVTTGANTVQGTPARPVVDGAFIPRNAGIGSSMSTTNVRVMRAVPLATVRLEAMVEVFNLFNRRNDLARVTVFGPGAYPSAPASNFGTVTVVGEPRVFQLGLRARF